MTIERWDLSPSSQPDRYLLKVRGPKTDVEKIVQAYNRVCHEPREMGDAIYQWAVYVVGATLNERLAIQDALREMMARPADTATSAVKVDLSGVLSELTMVLEGLTGLTEEEQAHVAKKMEEIQQREAQVSEKVAALPPAAPGPESKPAPKPAAPADAPKPTAPEPPKPAAPAPPINTAGPLHSAPGTAASQSDETSARDRPPAAEPPFEIVRDVARAPAPKAPEPPKPAAPPASLKPELPRPPAVPPAKAEPPAAPKPPAAPEPPKAPPPPAPSPAAAPKPAEAPKAADAPAPPKKADVPPDQLIQAVCFYAAGADAVKNQFIKQLTEVAQKKAKKPMTVQFLKSEPSGLDNKQAPAWIKTSQAAGAECAFILLTPDVLPDFLETAVIQMRQAGVHCLLIPQSDVDSRILYVDLMVELLLVKRKK